MRIPITPLAARPGARCVFEAATALEPAQGRLALATGADIGFDIVSLDVGSDPELEGAPPLGERLLPLKPVERFLPALAAAEERNPGGAPARLAVSGGGAAGGRSLALRQGYGSGGLGGRPAAIALIERGPLDRAGLPLATRRRLESACRAHGVAIGTGATLAAGADVVVWAAGAAAPAWLARVVGQFEIRGS